MQFMDEAIFALLQKGMFAHERYEAIDKNRFFKHTCRRKRGFGEMPRAQCQMMSKRYRAIWETKQRRA